METSVSAVESQPAKSIAKPVAVDLVAAQPVIAALVTPEPVDAEPAATVLATSQPAVVESAAVESVAVKSVTVEPVSVQTVSIAAIAHDQEPAPAAPSSSLSQTPAIKVSQEQPSEPVAAETLVEDAESVKDSELAPPPNPSTQANSLPTIAKRASVRLVQLPENEQEVELPVVPGSHSPEDEQPETQPEPEVVKEKDGCDIHQETRNAKVQPAAVPAAAPVEAPKQPAPEPKAKAKSAAKAKAKEEKKKAIKDGDAVPSCCASKCVIM